MPKERHKQISERDDGHFLAALPAVPPSGGAWEAAKGKGDGSSSPSASGGLS